MKSKSVSVQNLENLVRQTITAVPEVNEGTIRFHRMIYKQWDFKRSLNPKCTKSEQNHAKPQVTNDIRKTIAPFRKRYSFTLNLPYNISAMVIYHKLRRSMHKRRISRLSLKTQPAGTNVKNARKNSNVLRNIKSHLSRNSVQTSILDNNGSNFNGIQLFSNDSTKIVHRPSVGDHGKVIEIWNNRRQRINRLKNTKKNVLDVAAKRDRNNGSIEPQRKALKKSITFEAWKRSKIFAHRKLMKQLEEERQRKANEALEEIKKKEATRQVQIQYRKRQHRPIQIFPKRNRLKNKCDVERNVVATSKERKRVKFDEGNTATLMRIKKSNNINKGKKQLALMQKSLENVIFCSWLDQLNWILHKKYLRERRHLVQSFYCQPIYYGDATLYVR